MHLRYLTVQAFLQHRNFFQTLAQFSFEITLDQVSGVELLFEEVLLDLG